MKLSKVGQHDELVLYLQAAHYDEPAAVNGKGHEEGKLDKILSLARQHQSNPLNDELIVSLFLFQWALEFPDWKLGVLPWTVPSRCRMRKRNFAGTLDGDLVGHGHHWVVLFGMLVRQAWTKGAASGVNLAQFSRVALSSRLVSDWVLSVERRIESV